jgi:hypothetical protein
MYRATKQCKPRRFALRLRVKPSSPTIFSTQTCMEGGESKSIKSLQEEETSFCKL